MVQVRKSASMLLNLSLRSRPSSAPFCMTAALKNFSNDAALPQAKILLTVHLSQFVVSDV